MVSTGLIVEQIITGLSIGSRLFLVAIGLSLIFGVLDVLNFAHGVLYAVGAYMGIWVVGGAVINGGPLGGVLVSGLGITLLPGGNFWVGVVVAAVAVALVGVFIEAGFIRRIYDRGHLDQLLLTFAFVLIVEDVVRFYNGSGTRVVNPPELLQFNVVLAPGVSIPSYRAFVILMSVVVMGALFVVLRTTNIGRVVRATASDRDMARLLGINVPRLYTGVFLVGAALAGIGGALAAPQQAVTPGLGNQVIINAFVVVVIGGLGSFTGAFVGAYLIGLMIALGSIVIAGAGQLFPFVAMILVLLFKPQGLFGGAEA